MNFEYIPHTADVKFKAKGKDLNEVFANSALATYNILIDVKKVKLKEIREITLESNNKESLLYDFLEQLIILIDSENFIGGKINKLKLSKNNTKIEAEIIGDDVSNYDTHGDIKAATYSDMEIVEKKGNCYAIVVLDI
jgi:SHS2 domain-containing protein